MATPLKDMCVTMLGTRRLVRHTSVANTRPRKKSPANCSGSPWAKAKSAALSTTPKYDAGARTTFGATFTQRSKEHATKEPLLHYGRQERRHNDQQDETRADDRAKEMVHRAVQVMDVERAVGHVDQELTGHAERDVA